MVTDDPLSQSRQRSTPIGYIKKHWRGELSLPVSYWLNAFLGNIVAFTLVSIITASIEDSFSPVLILLALISTYSLVFAILVWQVTGTWRSAENYKNKTGTKGWAIAAQVMLVLAVIQSVSPFTDGFKQIIEVSKIATETDNVSNFQVELKSGTDLHITGYIAFKLVDVLDKYFKENRDIKSVHLNSLGGRTGPALRIANSILSKKVNTHAEVGCYSACTTVFIAGEIRVISIGTKLGFHQGAFPGVSDAEVKSVQKEEREFFLDRGVSNSFVRKAYNTPSRQMWYPSYLELMEANVVTHVKVGEKILPIKRYCRKADCDKFSTAPRWLQETAAEINLSQNLPKKIDAITSFDRTISGPKNNFTYLYTIHSKKHIDFNRINKKVRNISCIKKKLDVFFGNGITMHWKYRNSEGKTLHEVVLSPTDCKKFTQPSR